MKRAIFVALCALGLQACMTTKLPPPQATMESIIVLRDSGIAPTNVGDFKLAAGKKKDIDKSVSARGSPVQVEGDGTFSGYLRQSVINDLTAAGKYDKASGTVIEAELTENTLSAAGSKKASALLVVRFLVKRAGQTRFDKLVRQAAEWESSFIGAVAIPDAHNHFGEQFRLILTKLYGDPEFLNALRAN